jgi:hypothetical protein
VDDIWDLRNSVAPGAMGRVSDALIAAGVDPGFVDNFTSGDIDSLDMEDYQENMATLQEVLEKEGVSGMENVSDKELSNRTTAEQENDAFKEYVDSQIYAGFMEERRMYYGLSLSKQAEYRKANPAFAAGLDEYKELKCSYAAEHNVWSSYYYADWEEKCKGGTVRTGGSGGSGSRSGGYSRGTGTVTSGLQLGRRSTWDVRELARKPAMMGRGGAGGKLPPWPAKLAEKAGPDLINAIESGAPMTDAMQKLMESLKKIDNGKYAKFVTEMELFANREKPFGAGTG